MTVLVHGTPGRAVFGVRSDEHLRRQWKEARGILLLPDDAALTLYARADVTATNDTLAWLVANPGRCLTDAEGRPLLMVKPERTAAGTTLTVKDEAWTSAGDAPLRNGSASVFSQKLRRNEPVEALDLKSLPLAVAERRLFDLVYKGITDAITRYVWPTPAFHVVRRFAAWGVTPNMVTIAGLVLTVVAAFEFYRAEWIGGFLAAWLMTFFDTVDGKLARVTGTSTRLGDILDHGNDYLHPPVWWLCLVAGAGADGSVFTHDVLFASGALILGTYVVGRLTENVFKLVFRFNQYLWKPFDSSLRVVIARRNIILAIVQVGALLGDVGASLVVAAAWSVASIGLQSARTALALIDRWRGRPVKAWLRESAPATPYATFPPPKAAPAPTSSARPA